MTRSEIPPLKPIEISVTWTSVRMTYANNVEPYKPTEWLNFEVSLTSLQLPAPIPNRPSGDTEIQYLGAIRLAALRYLRDLVGDEIQRLSHLVENTSDVVSRAPVPSGAHLGGKNEEAARNAEHRHE